MEENNKVLIKLLNMSKIITVILVLILIVLTIGVSKMYSTGEDSYNNESETEYNTNYDVSMFEEIEASDIKKSTKGKTKVIYIGRETCGWCAAFLPNLWTAQEEYDFTTLYIDLAKIIDFNSTEFKLLDEKAFNTLNNLSGDGYESYMSENLGATPMVLIVKDNKIINAQTGYDEYDNFKDFLDSSL